MLVQPDVIQPKRRENRRERCWAYHCRRAKLGLKRRLRLPSGMSDSFPLWISHVAYPNFSDRDDRNVSPLASSSVGMEHADRTGQPQKRHHDHRVTHGHHQGVDTHASDCLSKREENQSVTEAKEMQWSCQQLTTHRQMSQVHTPQHIASIKESRISLPDARMYSL